MNPILPLTVLGCVTLLTLAVWPGRCEEAALYLPFGCLSVPLLAGWCLLVLVSAWRDLAGKTGRRRRGVQSVGVIVVTAALLWFHVPQRVFFTFAVGDLEGLAGTAPAAEGRWRGVGLDRWFGPYHVDRYGADARGGVFFRTHTGPDGIGPDEMSYGFAYRPNAEGTPFGDAHYEYYHLFGDWYGFAASDD